MEDEKEEESETNHMHDIRLKNQEKTCKKTQKKTLYS